MESPILLNTGIPIIIHSSKLNKTGSNNNIVKERPISTSKSSGINRRPTIASSIDLINHISSSNNNQNSNNEATTTSFVTTKTKISTNENDQRLFNSFANSSSNTVFHANDSFFLHKNQNTPTRQFGIINGEAYASPLINHTKTIFDNIKNEQQKLMEQANFKNTNILESNSQSQSSIHTAADKPKKRVSFNENLLEVHLIPTNENNNSMMDDANSYDEQQTTYSSISTPNIANAKRLFQSTRFYRTTRVLNNNNRQSSEAIPSQQNEIHILNEMRRNNLNYSPGVTSSLSRHPYFKTNQQAANRSNSMLNPKSSSNNDISESLNDKNLFKLSIKTIKFNNGLSGSSNGITIQPITENSIKSVMTIEPLNIKPKGFVCYLVLIQIVVILFFIRRLSFRTISTAATTTPTTTTTPASTTIKISCSTTTKYERVTKLFEIYIYTIE